MSNKPIKILLIEDNPGDTRLIREALKEAGARDFNVECVDRLSIGLKRLSGEDFDVVLLDPGLPDSQGLDTLERVVAQNPVVPVVVLTGLEDEMVGIEAVRRGAQDYLIKGKMHGSLPLRILAYAIERKKAEEEIRRVRDDYLSITNLTGDIIVKVDREGRWTFLNNGACQFWGRPREELIGKPFADYVHPDDRAKTMAVVEETESKKLVRGVVNRQKTPKGWRVVEWNGAAIFDEEGRYSGFQATGRDITERKKMEEKLKQHREHLEELVEERTTKLKEILEDLEKEVSERKRAENVIREQNERLKELDRMKSEFLSTAAHELRTPLTGILGFSEILLKKDLDKGRQNRFLKIINEEAKGLAKLINDLLDVSRIESGRGFKIKRAPIDLKKIIRENVGLFQSQGDKHTFKVNLPSDAGKIEADEDKIGEVIGNLISNAVKFSPQGREITISLERADEEVKISVTDAGMGIPKKDLPHIFEKFYRADSASIQAIRGTGLGLGIVKYIVESHGGKIWVETQSGKGSTFNFTLPIKAAKRGPGRKSS